MKRVFSCTKSTKTFLDIRNISDLLSNLLLTREGNDIIQHFIINLKLFLKESFHVGS